MVIRYKWYKFIHFFGQAQIFPDGQNCHSNFYIDIFPKLQATCHTALSMNHRSPVRFWWNLKSKATPRLISDFILEHAHNEHINPSKLMFNNIRKQPSHQQLPSPLGFPSSAAHHQSPRPPMVDQSHSRSSWVIWNITKVQSPGAEEMCWKVQWSHVESKKNGYSAPYNNHDTIIYDLGRNHHQIHRLRKPGDC